MIKEIKVVILIFLLSFIFLNFKVVASKEVIIDSWEDVNQPFNFATHTYPFNESGWRCGIGQSILTPSIMFILTKVEFKLLNIGSPNGSLQARIYEISGIHGINATPTGEPLAYSNNISATTLNEGIGEWITFIFYSGYVPKENYNYAIVVLPITDIFDLSNYSKCMINEEGTHDGNMLCHMDGFWQSGLTGMDTGFRIYGVEINKETNIIILIALVLALFSVIAIFVFGDEEE